ncbi:MAG: Zn-ribbon domain-containing OB-fold protein [candidate division WOR-3 bacterium]
MAFKTRITKALNAKPWYGELPVESLYTMGIAGEKFFRTLKDKGKIIGVRCENCDYVYVPPKMYCERCFAKLDKMVDVGLTGTLTSFTLVYVDVDGNPLPKPEIVGLIQLDGASTNLMHRLGECEIDELCIDMRVEAVLKPATQRTGSINDIKYFKPSKKR